MDEFNPRKPMNLRRRGIYLLPNLFTTATLFGGFYAVVAAMNGEFSKAAIAIGAAMIADSLDELHAMARAIGVPERGFHRRTRHPHYDLNDALRTRALSAGAIAISRRELGRMLLARSASKRSGG